MPEICPRCRRRPVSEEYMLLTEDDEGIEFDHGNFCEICIDELACVFEEEYYSWPPTEEELVG